MFLQNGTVISMNVTEFSVSSQEQKAPCGLLVEISLEGDPYI